eukprot:8955383-Karenia_brevis.AAC.1
MVEKIVEKYDIEDAGDQDFVMSLSDDRLALIEESLKTEYNKEFPAGLANAVPASCINTYGKKDIMRAATSLFVANPSLPTAPPVSGEKRPWPWNTPDRVTKSKANTDGSDIQQVCISDLILFPRKVPCSASVTVLLLNRSSVNMRE